MTIERLEQYSDLRNEAADLEQRVDRLRERARQCVADTVKASMTEYPFVEHTVTIKGYAKRSARHLGRVYVRLIEKRAELDREIESIEVWLEAIPNSRVRQLVRYHYVDGETWPAAASRVYGHPHADAARMLVRRYIEKNL